jgi:hypothetical protein
VPLYVGGTFLYALAVYGAYVFISTSNSIPKGPPIHAKPLDKQEDISHIYDSIAKKYDKEIWTSEFFMGMPLLRRSMAKRATVSVHQAVFSCLQVARANTSVDFRAMYLRPPPERAETSNGIRSPGGR